MTLQTLNLWLKTPDSGYYVTNQLLVVLHCTLQAGILT